MTRAACMSAALVALLSACTVTPETTKAAACAVLRAAVDGPDLAALIRLGCRVLIRE